MNNFLTSERHSDEVPDRRAGKSNYHSCGWIKFLSYIPIITSTQLVILFPSGESSANLLCSNWIKQNFKYLKNYYVFILLNLFCSKINSPVHSIVSHNDISDVLMVPWKYGPLNKTHSSRCDLPGPCTVTLLISWERHLFRQLL